MGRRLELHSVFLTMVANVYFQPPANVQMLYPCIVYMRDAVDTKFADDGAYLVTMRYQVTIIDRDPDSVLVDKVAQLPLSNYVQHFVTENLHHDLFSLFF